MHYHTIIIGAGASGLYLASELGRKGIDVLLLDHSDKIGKKILISGGGRCNFTNLEVTPKNYHGNNPHFVKSALARFSPWDIIDLLIQEGIEYYEKEQGQLFCKNSSKEILQALIKNVLKVGAKIEPRSQIERVTWQNKTFTVQCRGKKFTSSKLVIATGGLSYPQLGATDLGYRIAKQFGHTIVPQSAALVGLRTNQWPTDFFTSLAGVSLPVVIKVTHKKVEGDLLFTHHGISGPAVLTTSLYALKNSSIIINFLPNVKVREALQSAREITPKERVINLDFLTLPKKFKQALFKLCNIPTEITLAQLSNKNIEELSTLINRFSFLYTSNDGWKKAEVTRGGVSTDKISSKTLEGQLQPGLYFIGEVLDVTGELGGFNLHWAWASAHAVAEAISHA